MDKNGKQSEKSAPKEHQGASPESLEQLAQKARQTEKELEELKKRILELQQDILRRLRKEDHGSSNS